MGEGFAWPSGHGRRRGPLYVLNGDELIDVDLAALLAGHNEHGAAATIVVAPLPTAFGVVDIDDDDRVDGFQDSPQLPFWAHAGVNVFDDEALARLPEKGDHERTTLPELAAEGKLYAHRHAGLWLTVNTPKDLRVADEAPAREPRLADGGCTRPMSDHLTSPNFGAAVRVRHRADEGREAVGPRADLGPDRRLLREDPVRQGRRVAQPPVPPREGRVVADPLRPGPDRDGPSRATRRRTRRSSRAGAAFRMRPGTIHRVRALEDTTIIEVSTPQLEDVVRLEDRYGRVEP